MHLISGDDLNMRGNPFVKAIGNSQIPSPKAAISNSGNATRPDWIDSRPEAKGLKRLRTWSGTSPSTSPPKRATSLTSEDDRNDHLGLVAMNSVSISPMR